MEKNLSSFLRKQDVINKKPAQEWEEGLPLGNGDMGVMVWGDGNPLKLTIDKADVWDTRNPEWDSSFRFNRAKELHQAGKKEEFLKYIKAKIKYNDIAPTKLGVGRIEIRGNHKPLQVEKARLSLAQAVVKTNLTTDNARGKLEVFVSRTRPLILVRWPDSLQLKAKYKSFFHLVRSGEPKKSIGYPHIKADLSKYGYREPLSASYKDAHYSLQEIPDGGRVAVVWKEVKKRGFCELRLSIAYSLSGEDVLEIAYQNIEESSSLSWRKIFREHAAWWNSFWEERSIIHLPDAKLENLYHLEMYKFASSSRQEGIPISLVGVWSPDEFMPPWQGDYHNDINTEMSYWPAYAGNCLDLAEPFNRYMIEQLEAEREHSTQVFGFECAKVPSNGMPTGRIGSACVCDIWVGINAWLGHHLWLYWLYSQDKDFLKKKAMPYFRESVRFYLGILEKDEKGFYNIPFSYSPEWFGGPEKGVGPTLWNNQFAGFGKNPSCDLALVRNLFSWAIESSQILGQYEKERALWQEVLDHLAPYPAWKPYGILVFEDVPYSTNHRHLSHLLCIYPLGDLNIEGTEEERELLRQSIENLIIRGTGEWAGWSYSHAACIAARVNMPHWAVRLLHTYLDYFVTRTGFHKNGEEGIYGLTLQIGSAITHEGGFGAATAIQEMCLQSWGGIIRIFPAIPQQWKELYFLGLRAEGAFVVSAWREKGETVGVDILSEKGKKCVLKNPFGEKSFLLSNGNREVSYKLSGNKIIFATEKGKTYSLRCKGKRPDKPLLRPASPGNTFGIKL